MKTILNLKKERKSGNGKRLICGMAICGILLAGCGEKAKDLPEETGVETQDSSLREEAFFLSELESRIRRLEELAEEPDTGAVTEPDAASIETDSSGAERAGANPVIADPDADYRFEVSEEGYATITEYVGTEQSVLLPSSLGGYPVVAIGENAFRNGKLREITLPDGVRRIDWFAFYGCFQLEQITLPASVVSIGYGAFELVSPALQFTCPEDSYAWRYAQSYGIVCRTGG